MSDRTNEMSEIVWEIAVEYDWRLSVRNQVALSRWMAYETRITQRSLVGACDRLGLVVPKRALTALRHRVVDHDKRRLVR